MTHTISLNEDALNHLPCQSCLVLPACLGRMSERKGLDEKNAYGVMVTVLGKCSLLNEYVRPHNCYDYNLTYRYTAKTFFLMRLGKI